MDPPATLTYPLSRKGFELDPVVAAHRDYSHLCPSDHVGDEAVILLIECPWRCHASELITQCRRVHAVDHLRVAPFLYLPDATFHIDCLFWEKAKQNLAWASLIPHGADPITGTASSTSRSDIIGLPLGDASDGNFALAGGERRLRLNPSNQTAMSARRPTSRESGAIVSRSESRSSSSAPGFEVRLTCSPELAPFFGRVRFSRERTNEAEQVQR